MTADITFKDIVGLDFIKEVLHERIIEQHGNKKELLENGYTLSSGIILYGIPGTGKTMLAKAVINELLKNNLDYTYHIVDAGDIMSSSVGDSAKQITALFKNLREKHQKHKKDYVLVIDEIETLIPKRTGRLVLSGERTSTFLKEIGGLTDDNSVFVIGTTNRPWDIDPAFYRSGRFEGYHVPPPDKIMRLGLIEKYITSKMKIEDRIKIDSLVDHTEGYVGADFMEMGKHFFMLSKKRQKKGTDTTITAMDFINWITSVHKTTDDSIIKILKFEAAYAKYIQGDSSEIDDLSEESAQKQSPDIGYWMDELCTHSVN